MKFRLFILDENRFAEGSATEFSSEEEAIIWRDEQIKLHFEECDLDVEWYKINYPNGHLTLFKEIVGDSPPNCY